MTASGKRLEIWAGHECTVARLGDVYRCQGAETGHTVRAGDLEQIAALGVKTLRYPALWEKIAPDHPQRCEWAWHDARFADLRRLGLDPIVGLLHHGSGPRYTSLLDPKFPELLAGHAARVAARYPWARRFTPVNEPLTTARFSALYGHWHPHLRDEGAFLRALLNECRATVLAMRAIRCVSPGAELVQTEDLGKIFSTPALRDQADYENERRWLSFDLLCGRVDRHHPWRRRFLDHGAKARDLDALVDEPCPPDILGVNHYLTSDRYLDERLDAYPPQLHGGNGRRRYADAEAVRIAELEGSTGFFARLMEAWERYKLPLAVTEAHHGCTRDEQLRWLFDVHAAAQAAQGAGADVRAVTVWALFGAMDWNSLLTRADGHYEAGAFDIRSAPPRRTALGRAVAALAAGRPFDHPVLDSAGWWRRPGRHYRPSRTAPAPRRADRRKVLITGAAGTLGRAMARICAHRGLDHIGLTRAELDIADPKAAAAAIDAFKPWAVVNAAGYVGAFERERCMRDNALGPAALAQACAEKGVGFVTFSSDLVFDGGLGRPYVESDAPAPLCDYGHSKLEGERRVARACPHALVVRSSAFFCPWDVRHFAARALRRLNEGRIVAVSAEESVAPTYVPDLVHGALDLLIDGESGVWHLTNGCEITWHEFALRLAERGAAQAKLVRRLEGEQRRNTALASARGRLLPPLEGAIERFFREREFDWRAASSRPAQDCA